MSNDLKQELTNDLEFSSLNISDKLSNHANIHVKWMDRLTKERVVLAKLNIDKKRIVRNAVSFLQGRTLNKENQKCPFVLDRWEVKDVYLPAHEDVVNIDKKIILQQTKVKELEAACDQIKQLYWNMKSYIEWQKFEAGIN